MWIESRLILSALDRGRVKVIVNGSKVDWVNLPPVGGLKWIDVDWDVIITGRGILHVTRSVHLVEMATSGPWSTEETRALLDVWGADNVQCSLDRVVRNRTVYQRVANGLAELGFEQTWQQCKTKVKNLVQRYRKVSVRFIL